MLLGANPLVDRPVILLHAFVQYGISRCRQRPREMPLCPWPQRSPADKHRALYALITRGCGWERFDSDLLNRAFAASSDQLGSLLFWRKVVTSSSLSSVIAVNISVTEFCYVLPKRKQFCYAWRMAADEFRQPSY